MKKTEIRISGLGGQGVILSGMIIGRAATIYAEKHATMIQSFGPEARGSSCSAELIVDNEPILYPYVKTPDILVAMSNDGYQKYKSTVSKDGILVVEEDLVRIDPQEKRKVFRCHATKIAEDLGRHIVLNIVMVGFFASVSKLIDAEAYRQSIRATVPEHMLELNLKAFDLGFAAGGK